MVALKRIIAEKVDFPSLVINALSCVILLLLYALVLSQVLPDGINQHFNQRLLAILPVPALVLTGLAFYLKHRTGLPLIKPVKLNLRTDYKDLLLLLIPLTPVARYVLLNMDILSIHEGVLVITIFLIISYLLTFVIPTVFQYVGSKVYPMMAGLSFSYLTFNMAALAADFNWHLAGSLKIQLPILAATALIAVLIYSKDKKYLQIAAVLFFVAGIATLGSTTILKPDTVDESTLQETLNEKEPVHRPDIFLLAYESYVENETMLQYGIDNSEQENFLEEQGYHIYRGTYSAGPNTITSMDKVLDVSPAVQTRLGISGNGRVQNVLRDIGYTTYGVFSSDYMFRGTGSFYDYSFPEELDQRLFISRHIYLLVSRQILEGEFRFDAALEFQKVDYAEYLSEKRQVLSDSAESPVFLYSHNEYPGHSQNSGQCLGNEIEIYERQLRKANEEMQKDVQIAVENNPNAIIIVCGDHGPYLTKNCTATGSNYDISDITRLDVQDRFGSFLAIRWPGNANIDHSQIAILQDIFLVIFSWMYDNRDFMSYRLKQKTLYPYTTSGVVVINGYIVGGPDDGLPLFESSGLE